MTYSLLRAKNVAKILNVSDTMVYRLARIGALRAVVFQGWEGERETIRFREEDVRAFIDAHTAKA